MWLQSNKDEYTDLLKQRLMGVLREVKKARETLATWHYAHFGHKHNEWEDREPEPQDAIWSKRATEVPPEHQAAECDVASIFSSMQI